MWLIIIIDHISRSHLLITSNDHIDHAQKSLNDSPLTLTTVHSAMTQPIPLQEWSGPMTFYFLTVLNSLIYHCLRSYLSEATRPRLTSDPLWNSEF